MDNLIAIAAAGAVAGAATSNKSVSRKILGFSFTTISAITTNEQLAKL